MKVFACLATSLDGRLGPAGVTTFSRITSEADMRHLAKVRNQAQVTVFGGETFRTYPKEHRPADPDHRLTHVILSRKVAFDWSAPLFQSGARIVIASPFPCKAWSDTQSDPSESILLSGDDPIRDVETILGWCEEEGYSDILVEGGGTIFEQFLAADRIDDLYLTLAPILIADPESPALIPGHISLLENVHFKLLDCREEKGDVFLHYRLIRQALNHR